MFLINFFKPIFLPFAPLIIKLNTMSVYKTKERIAKFDYLVSHNMTGTPGELATQLNLSKRQLYNFLNELKEMNVPVKYSKEKQCYHYTKSGSLQFDFIDESPLSRAELKGIEGGFQIFSTFFQSAMSFHC